jgi:hypothetical protein
MLASIVFLAVTHACLVLEGKKNISTVSFYIINLVNIIIYVWKVQISSKETIFPHKNTVL